MRKLEVMYAAPLSVATYPIAPSFSLDEGRERGSGTGSVESHYKLRGDWVTFLEHRQFMGAAVKQPWL